MLKILERPTGAGYKDTLCKTNHDTCFDSSPEREWNKEARYPIYGKSRQWIHFLNSRATKTSKQGNRVLEITFHIFPEENFHCPYKNLEYYLEVTEPWRIKGNRNQLHLSHIETQKPILTPTITQWIKTLLTHSFPEHPFSAQWKHGLRG